MSASRLTHDHPIVAAPSPGSQHSGGGFVAIPAAVAPRATGWMSIYRMAHERALRDIADRSKPWPPRVSLN